ncbi:EscU/YscU/HrcU family type III secretion system export apparatus switch protein [Nitratireductor pacificus]|uniref:Flagellar biosynthetic protein n=1 Tax=Nitratireductor pacificus pht-3B TaxID=391937 RepID=K2MKC7_9HYPH|nr:EscU/YscU/HrcU family type III secretion system export apparatus switch protein [Nitratireductor pacificus]EKF17677.1 Flagellar biosynthetic protein [Nitratireductor pacificus pht-3B]
MNEQAEEKQLPASDRKLREGRRKGQVSHSRDLISGFTLVAALVYLFYAWPGFLERLYQLIDTVTSWPGDTFEAMAARSARHVVLVVATAVVPVTILVVVLTIVFSVLATRGPVFSVEPVKPKFEHINPAKGFMRIFSLRNVVEFAKGLTKIVLLTGIFLAIFLTWLQSLFEAPACGETCLEQIIKAVLIPLGAAAALTFVVTGVIDLFLQLWLFLRDMRMTKTEYKRERKDLEGDPHIRQERNRQRQQNANGTEEGVKTGIQNANLVFFAEDRLVGLLYVKDQTSVPVVVAKGQGAAARAQLAEAKRRGLAITDDREALEMLYPGSTVGEFIGQSAFPSVIRNLIRFGLV